MTIGRTVNELKASMTHAELVAWWQYRRKWGPLDVTRRYDRPAAVMAATAVQLMGGKVEVKDFMPYPMDDEHDDEFKSVMKELGYK